MNIFKSLCSSCNFSPEDAAEYLDIREDTAHALWSGKREPADGIIIELKKCVDGIYEEARKSLAAGAKLHEDTAIQRAMIEMMPLGDVLETFKRVDFKDMEAGTPTTLTA